MRRFLSLFKYMYSKSESFLMAAITYTECQAWAQILRSTFLKLILWRVNMSIEKNIHNILLGMTVPTNIIIYFCSKIKTVGGRSLLTKTRTIFITIHGFEFSYISRIHVSVTFSYYYSFCNIPEFGNNLQFKP